ncbi:hypothetical protein CRUP_019444, partial [Coryphaenoides rupestris]
ASPFPTKFLWHSSLSSTNFLSTSGPSATSRAALMSVLWCRLAVRRPCSTPSCTETPSQGSPSCRYDPVGLMWVQSSTRRSTQCPQAVLLINWALPWLLRVDFCWLTHLRAFQRDSQIKWSKVGPEQRRLPS